VIRKPLWITLLTDSTGELRPFSLIILVAFALLFFVHTGSGAGSAEPPDFTGVSVPAPLCENRTIYADFFYGDACSHCHRVKPLVEGLAETYPQIHVRYREIYFNMTNREAYWDALDRYGLEFEVIPLLIIDNTTMKGEDEIRAGLEPYLSDTAGGFLDQSDPGSSLGHGVEQLREAGENDPGDPAAARDGISSSRMDITVGSVLVAAAVDSINPCAIAVLAVLLACLTSLRDRKRLLQIGLVYIGTVFVVYLVSGLGFLAIVQKSELSEVVFTFAGIITAIAGLINIGEALLGREGFSLSIPESEKGRISRYVQRISIPSAVVLGSLVSVVELPCTGGMYLAILGLLGSRMTFLEGLPYLILYNLIFILPLVVILLVVYSGVSPDRIDAWRTGKRRRVRFAMGSVMLGLGGAMLLGLL